MRLDVGLGRVLYYYYKNIALNTNFDYYQLIVVIEKAAVYY